MQHETLPNVWQRLLKLSILAALVMVGSCSPAEGSKSRALCLFDKPIDRLLLCRGQSSSEQQIAVFIERSSSKELLRQIRSPLPGIRVATARRIGSSRDTSFELSSALIALLKDSVPEVRSAAISATYAMTLKAPARIGALLRNPLVSRDVLAALKQIGPEAGTHAQTVEELLGSADPSVRLEALYVLGRLNVLSDRRASRVSRLASDSAEAIRLAALEAAFLIAKTDSVPLHAIRRALTDSSLQIRMRASQLLAATQGIDPLENPLFASGVIESERTAIRIRTDGVSGLLPRATASRLDVHSSPSEKEAAVIRAAWDYRSKSPLKRSVPETELEQLVPTITKWLASSNTQQRLAAARALLGLGPLAKGSVGSLTKALTDSVPSIRRTAAAALGRIGERAVAAVGPLADVVDHDPLAAAEAEVALSLILGPNRTIRQTRSQSWIAAKGGWAQLSDARTISVQLALRDTSSRAQRTALQILESIDTIPSALVNPICMLTAAADSTISELAAQQLRRRPVDAAKCITDLLAEGQGKTAKLAAARSIIGGVVHREAFVELVDKKQLATKLEDLSRIDSLQFTIVASVAIAQLLGPTSSNVRLYLRGIRSTDATLRAGVVRTLVRLSTDLADRAEIDSIRVIQEIADSLVKAGADSATLADVQRAERHLRAVRFGWRVQTLSTFVQNHPYGALAISIEMIALVVSLFAYVFFPLQLLSWCERFGNQKIELGGEKTGKVSIRLSSILVFGLFRNTNRLLDAWVKNAIKHGGIEFLSKATVSARSAFVPLPVRVDDEVVAQPSPETFSEHFRRERTLILVHGEGGSGKTTLACQVARWMMSESPEIRDALGNRMVPVLIEQDIESGGASIDASALVESVRGQIQAFSGAPRKVSDSLLTSLLEKKRVLVIIDRLSELSDSTRSSLRFDRLVPSINALVITSRAQESLNGMTHSSVIPMRIQGNRLSALVDGLLNSFGVRDSFSDSDFFTLCLSLSALVGDREITVLFAQMYVMLAVRRHSESTSVDTPKTVPQLVLQYLNELNATVTRGRRNEREVQRVARVIARECLSRRFTPGSCDRSTVINQLSDLRLVEELMDYLENSLNLIQTVGVERTSVRFAIDPIAEYLASIEIVDRLGVDEQGWERLFAELQRADPSRARTQPFRGALSDVVRDRIQDSVFSSKIADILISDTRDELAVKDRT